MRAVGPGSAEQRHSASKTRVNALVKRCTASGTRVQTKKPTPIASTLSNIAPVDSHPSQYSVPPMT